MTRSIVAAGKGQLLKASTRAVPLGTVADSSEPSSLSATWSYGQDAPKLSSSMAKCLPAGAQVPAAISGFSTSSAARYFSSDTKKQSDLPMHKPHHDMEVPSFDEKRSAGTKDLTGKKSKETEAVRKNKYYAMLLGTSACTLYAVENMALTVLVGRLPSRDSVCVSKIEVNTNDIPPGKTLSFEWIGKPLFIRNRLPEEIETEESLDVASLRHPEKDSERFHTPQWLCVIGVCTHLGCTPLFDSGEYGEMGGYFCPCHGSHYDGSGRIRKGPAPANLEVPPYEINGTIMTIG